MSLPYVLGTTMENIPACTPYLTPPPADVENWKKRMGSRPGPRIGLAWAGNPAHREERNRSIALSAFGPLARRSDATFYSLQKGHAASQTAHPPAGLNLIDWTQDLRDFADTAALMAQLDLIISVDTAVAHLAGAMGKPVWTLLPYVPDWRWMLHRDDSPWYSTMRLFRQPRLGDWRSVIDRIAEALNKA
jgi:hypothetical protein